MTNWNLVIVLVFFILCVQRCHCHSCGSGSFSTIIATGFAPLDVWKFDPCCEEHDRCYDDQLGQSVCDDTFLACMLSTCPSFGDTIPLVKSCKTNAVAFHKVVELYGAEAYANSRENQRNDVHRNDDCEMYKVHKGDWVQQVCRYSNGDIYEGSFKEGHFHGKGIFRFKDGGVYEGDFMQGQFHGEGVYTEAGAIAFEGTWENGFHRNGVYMGPDGTTKFVEKRYVNHTPSPSPSVPYDA